MSDDAIYSHIVYYDEVKDIQVRLGVNEFRDVEYLFLRKYYRDFEGDWRASNEGVNMPLGIENSKEMFVGLLQILSMAESKQAIIDHFKELLEETYQE